MALAPSSGAKARSAEAAERTRRVPAALAALGSCFHTFVFAIYPILIVVGLSAGIVPLDAAIVARCLAIAAAAAAAVLLALKPLMPDLSNRAAWLTFVLIAFNIYDIVGGTSTDPMRAALYTLASGGIAAFVVRPWRIKPRRSTPLNLAACTVLGVNVYAAAPLLGSDEPWKPAADALIGGVIATAAQPEIDRQRDIYYIVLDAFGRPDVLSELYQLDLRPFVEALESRGFTVPAQSQSNYSQTFLSLASSLNLSYLDPLQGTLRESADRRPLDYLIQHNALSRLAKKAGYQVIAVGSNYTATERLAGADVCMCEQFGLNEFEVATINLTPLRALPIDRWTYSAHRRKIAQEFRYLETSTEQARPKLVFAHLISPHPPFVFAPDGSPRTPDSTTFSFRDGSRFEGSRAEYVAGYRDQARFVAARILAVVDRILSRPGPSPVIVMHGDHGPGSMWNSDEVVGNTRERMSIFSAYRLPDADHAPLASHVTPVNGLRIVANRYLGTSLPAVPDVSYASGWRRPYQWVTVRGGEE